MHKRDDSSTFFIDESGAKASSGNLFVVAGLKIAHPGRLQRKIEALRDSSGFTHEFKFSRINRDRLPVFRRLVEAVGESEIRLIGSVVNRSEPTNPFKCGDEEWQVHARVAAQLVVGNLNQGEHGAVILDHRSTKPNVSFGDTVKGMANRRLEMAGIVSAVTIDSQANDLLQVADLIAGAIANHRARHGQHEKLSHKDRVAADLAMAFGVPSFQSDIRQGRVNVMTVTKMGQGRPRS